MSGGGNAQQVLESHALPRLIAGNLVINNEVPKKLLNLCALKNETEFTTMRYTAATCDPNEFQNSGFTLRQALYDPPRRTELFIVMTMYNEEEELFCRTMHGVMKNIAHLCKRDRSKTWGKEGWKKVVVCIVSDGRQKINSRTLSVIASIGAYQDGVAKVCLRRRSWHFEWPGPPHSFMIRVHNRTSWRARRSPRTFTSTQRRVRRGFGELGWRR